MKTHGLRKGMMTLAAFVLVGGAACEQAEEELVDEGREALGGDDGEHRPGRGMKRGPGFGPHFAESIDLTGEQQEAISGLRERAEDELSGTRERMSALRDELEELWRAEQPDAEAILAKHAEMDALRDSMRDHRRSLKRSIDEVLTAEQREQIAEHRANGPMKGRRGPRGGGFGMEGRGGGPGVEGMGPRGGNRMEGMGPRGGNRMEGMGPRGGGRMEGMGPRGGGRMEGMGPRAHRFGRGGLGGGRGMAGMGHFGERALDRLDLTEEQQTQIDELRAQAREATTDARAEMESAREAMRAARSSGEWNEATADSIHDRADAARRTIRESMVRTKVAILGLLTADQRTELQTLHSERGEHRGRGRGHHGRGFGRGHGQSPHSEATDVQ